MSEDNTKEKESIAPKQITSNSDPKTTNTLPIPAQNPSSSSSVKLRKSSNIFSSLVKKARRKKTPNKSDHEEVKNIHISSQNLSCASTLSLGVHTEEIEISCQNYEKKCSQNQEMTWEGKGLCSETNTSNHSLGSSTKNPKNVHTLPVTQKCSQTFKDDVIQTDSSKNVQLNQNTDNDVDLLEDYENAAISSFLAFKKPTLNVELADGLQYVQETVNKLHESEKYIIDLLTKYIKDPGVQKQLTSAISQHVRLQWNAERRSCSLANDMWMHQIEIGRAQEKILQETLNSLVKQNRQLQVENESLFRKHAKAVKMLKGYSDKPRYHESDPQMDSILRHNEKLQVKLETVYKKCESLEGELQMFQKQNDNMEQQLRILTMKMQEMKAIMYKMKTEYDLEQVSLNSKIDTKEQILKEALEAGDILLEDLDSIKRQLKNMPFGLNWSKFMVRGSCLTDLIHMCRSCMNELSKEVLNMHNESTLKDKDISTLRETNTRLQENLKKSTFELDSMAKKLDENHTMLNDLHANEQKCRMLENELKISEGRIEDLKLKQESGKSVQIKNVADFEIYKQQIQEKDKTIEQTKLFLANTTSENFTLKNEIAVLNRLIQETGAGDVVMEIENNQREIELYQKELKKLEKEKNQLLTELTMVRSQNSALLTNQENAYKNLQRQIEDLKGMNEEIDVLRQKYDTEHQTVLSLQNERIKYLEEKNILKSIVQHLRAELTKIKKLEEHLTGVTKEASKLAMAAEYNKQQGEKLKKEVVERDTVIARLKNSVRQLNELQMQNTKEKLSLCFELNEVCQVKEKLSEVLNTEVRKNSELGQAKAAIVTSVSTQMQKMEEKQRNERTAIKILLKDIKVFAEEKEVLSKENSKLQLEIEQLSLRLFNLGKKFEELSKEITKKDQEILELRKDRDHFEKKKKELHEKLENEQAKYDMNVKQLKKLIEQLRNDKRDFQTSNDYLKNNMEKLRKDLNTSRENEKLTNDLLNKSKLRQDDQQKLLTVQDEQIKNMSKANDKLIEEKLKLSDEKEKSTKEINYLKAVMDTVVNDFEKSIKSSENKERLLRIEIEDLKSFNQKYVQEVEDLKRAKDLKERQINELSDLVKEDQLYQKKYIALKEEIDDLKTAFSKLKETNTDLENQLSDAQEEQQKSTEHLQNVEKECQVLESHLKIVLDQKEEDYVFYKKHIAELMRTKEDVENQYQEVIKNLKQQLQDVNNKMVNEKAAYDTLSQIHKEVSGKFMKSIKDLVEAKNSREETLEILKENQATMNELENEKAELGNRLNQLNEELEKNKAAVIQLSEENNLLQNSYNKALDKCVALEHKVKAMEVVHQQRKIMEDDSFEQSENLQHEINSSKKELEKTTATIHQLKMEISRLQQEIAILEIERSETTLELHETRKKLETERNLSEQLKNTHKLVLAAVLQLKDGGKVDPADCIHLLHMVRSTGNLPVEEKGTKKPKHGTS